MLESDDPSWHAYPGTILRFTRHGFFVDLRVPLSAETIERLRRVASGHAISVLTAFNPRGRIVAEAENLRRHEELAARLKLLGCAFTPCDGTDPAGVHIEPGFAAAIDSESSERLAKEFEQSAYFHFDGRAFWLLPAIVKAASLRLPPRSSTT